jgi:glycosyltransferase involved in cell wall biosynthesis
MGFSVLLPVYSHGQGVTYHLAHEAVALSAAAQAADVPLYVAAPPQEQAPGLWNMVRTALPAGQALVLEDETAALARAATRLVEQHRRLVVHLHGNRQLKALVDLRREASDRVRLVYTVNSFRNNTWQRLPYSWLVSRMLRRYVDYTVFLSPFSANQFARHGAIMRGGRGGISIHGVESQDELAAVTPADGQIPSNVRPVLKDPEAVRFLYLATVYPGKGHHWLIDGLAPSMRRHRNAYVIMAGRQDQAYVARLRRKTGALRVQDQILLPGLIDRNVVPWLIKQVDAGIVASRSETFGHAVVEPMANGKPVISTRKGVAEWLVIDYLTGFGVEYGDCGGVERAVEYIVTHRDEAARMGQTAARLVRNLFDWDAVAASRLRVYSSLW